MLLRVLQEQKITRVGGSESIKIDVRVLAATNKNLEEEINEHRFREDLYHRVNVIPIEIPNLDQRKEDIPAIAEAWLRKLQSEDISLAGVMLTEDGLQAKITTKIMERKCARVAKYSRAPSNINYR